MNLKPMDVKRLTEEPSARVRSMLAAKIAMDYRSGNFTQSESDIAADIFRILLRDTERKVRQAMAEQLSHCPYVPRDVILRLANDEMEVAVHILEYSDVLTEDDLIAIVRSTREIMKLRAIARRDTVSEKLSNSLMDTDNELVLRDLFKNKGAVLEERHMIKSWTSISASQTLLETLVNRGGLPLTIAEKLFFAVSEELKRVLSRQYRLHVPSVQKAANDAREWEMLGIVPNGGSGHPNDDERVEELVLELHSGGRLTHSLLIRALCMGDLNLFEAGLAKLAGVPRVNARILLMDNGSLGFQSIYKTSSMPDGFYEAVRTLLRLSLEETEYGSIQRPDFRKRIIDRIYVDGYHRTIENMEYLLSIIGGKIATPASTH